MHKILNKRGNDVIFTGINYAFRLILKPVLLLAIPLLLTEIQQGYWYTFTSLAALTTFADLGLTTIISQFAAHETALLTYDAEKKIYLGDNAALSSLYQTMKRWFTKAMLVITPIIFIIGCVTMGKDSQFVRYIIPWLIYVVFNSVNFYIQANLAFFEGCNQIGRAQRIKCIDAIVVNIFAIVLLMMGVGVYALGCSMALACLIDFMLYKRVFKKLLNQLEKVSAANIKWIEEIMPLLKRYAIGWISNYITFQLYNPLTFRMFGAETAGQVGYTITIISSIYSMANVWMYVVTPALNVQAEQKDWRGMDKTLKSNLPLAAGTFAFGMIMFCIMLNIPIVNSLIGKRILPIRQVVVLGSAYFFQVFVNAIALYLRAHKEEPLMYVGIISAIWSISATIMILLVMGKEYIFVGYLSSFLYIMPRVGVIFYQKRKEWHQKE